MQNVLTLVWSVSVPEGCEAEQLFCTWYRIALSEQKHLVVEQHTFNKIHSMNKRKLNFNLVQSKMTSGCEWRGDICSFTDYYLTFFFYYFFLLPISVAFAWMYSNTSKVNRPEANFQSWLIEMWILQRQWYVEVPQNTSFYEHCYVGRDLWDGKS